MFSSGKIDVTFGEREVRFASETRTVTARLIEGEFPNYEQLIPSGYPNRLTVSRGDARGSGPPDADRRRGP